MTVDYRTQIKRVKAQNFENLTAVAGGRDAITFMRIYWSAERDRQRTPAGYIKCDVIRFSR